MGIEQDNHGLSNLVDERTTIGHFKYLILGNINLNINPVIMVTH